MTEQFNGWNEEQRQEYRRQTVEKYGKQTVEDSEQKMAVLGKEAVQQLQREWFDICNVIYERRDYGAADGIIQNQAANLHRWVNNFWDCNNEAFRGLGHTYSASADFRKNISGQFGPEMPDFLEEVIGMYCDNPKNA